MAKSSSNVTTIDDESDVAVQAPVEAKVTGSGHDAGLSGEKRTVTIHAQDNDGGNDAVSLGLNGVAYQIPRGVPCTIPVELFEVLKHARVMRMTQAPGGAIKETNAQRFAYEVE